MLKAVLVSILLLVRIFVGFFPASINSPHNRFLTSLGYEIDIHYGIYIVCGTIFYILAAFISQMKEITWK